MSARLTRSGGFQTAAAFRRFGNRLSLLPAVLIFSMGSALAADAIVIGSKKFTESYVLSEIAARALREASLTVQHKQGMGGTIILWEALRGAQIDVYPEYTGTIAEEIVKDRSADTPQKLSAALNRFGVAMTAPLGFNNTYALVMRRDEADRLGIRTISDLRTHPELKIGLT